MNKVQDFISNIPDDDVKTIVGEIKEMDDTGILVDGKTRRYIHGLMAYADIPHKDAMTIVIHSTLRRAAYAYCNIN